MLSAVTAAPLALAVVTAGPAYAAQSHLARTATDPVSAASVTGTDCPDTPSPSFCLYSWASGTGSFVPTGFAPVDGKIVVTGVFSGTTTARNQTFAVERTIGEVAAGSVSIGRDAVTVTAATTSFGPYVPGGAAVTTSTLELPALTYPAPGAVFARIGTMTVRLPRADAARAARDWRRAGRNVTAQAAALDGALPR